VLVLRSGPGDSGTGADAEVGTLVLSSIVSTFDDVTPVLVIDGDGSFPDPPDGDLHELSLPPGTTIEHVTAVDGSWFREVPPTDRLIVTPAPVTRPRCESAS
jgi:hypothetical protein